MKFFVLAITLTTFLFSNVSCKVRGVAPERSSLYDDKKPVFTCLDGSNKIPFNQVNDDYCDCRDGSDEPGTSACLNGQFACQNLGYIVTNIPSSRINDGICDCCDGSDEFDSKVSCENTCEAEAIQMKEEQEKLKKLKDEGFIKRRELMQLGAELRKSLQDRINELEAKKIKAEEEKIRLEEIKNQHEQKANEAKAVQDKIFEEKANELKRQETEKLARSLFSLLDLDQDSFLTPEELVKHQELDILFNSDGTFTVEESLQLLDQNQRIDVNLFITGYYEKISPHLSKKDDQAPTTDAPSLDEDLDNQANDYETTEGNTDESDNSENQDGHNNESENSYNQDGHSQPENKPEGNRYDEETQRLIDESNNSKRQLEEAESNVRNFDNEINVSKTKLGLDVGPNAEFANMIDKCFEYEDREYIYKLCPFEKTVQKSKSNHQETSIGHWKSWNDDPAKKYTSMKFDNGLACWNGPQRSTNVLINCGIENKLVAVSEPNRCEYEMKFDTPAVCEQFVEEQPYTHEDL